MIEDLTPALVAARLADPGTRPVLVDVREHWERERAVIPDSTDYDSLHVPLMELPSRLDDLPRDRDVVVYCHHGTRSRQAVMWLAAQGFGGEPQRLANLSGGIDAWSRTVDPTIEQY
jgi:rhodanese-related sulfurtransferase